MAYATIYRRDDGVAGVGGDKGIDDSRWRRVDANTRKTSSRLAIVQLR